MSAYIAGLLRRAANRLDSPPRMVIHSVVTHEDAVDGAAMRDALLLLKRRNGGRDLFGLS